MSNIPEAITNEEKYMAAAINNTSLSDTPEAISRKDIYTQALCEKIAFTNIYSK